MSVIGTLVGKFVNAVVSSHTASAAEQGKAIGDQIKSQLSNAAQSLKQHMSSAGSEVSKTADTASNSLLDHLGGLKGTVENSLAALARKTGKTDLNWKSSIVDLMKLLGMDASLDVRKKLAQELGYKGDHANSADMNRWLYTQLIERVKSSLKL